ncbi:MAG: SIR2 family protein [Amphiplicatus sp.]
MSETVPPELVAAIREGRVVLFLGAGASRGATDGSGNQIPLGDDLASELVELYLGPEYAGVDFRTAYDLSCSARDVRTVQAFVRDRLQPFQPASFHSIIPGFAWAGLATTNYDLVIERAYQVKADRIQNIIPLRSDSDAKTTPLRHGSIFYVKLHGCITQASEVSPPLVASTEQLIAFREGRQGQFKTFLEWGQSKTIIFIGYSFKDTNLRQLLDEIIREGDKRPRHYVVDPSILPAMATYWSDRRIGAVRLSTEAFLGAIETEIPTATRSLGAYTSTLERSSHFTHFINKSTQSESESLSAYLMDSVDFVYPELESTKADALAFYRGTNQGWSPIQDNLDIRQRVVGDILSDAIISISVTTPPDVVLLKGHAGSGKTVSLRRIAWDAAKVHKKFCIFITRQHSLDVEKLEEIFSLTSERLYLFIDNVSEHIESVVTALMVASRLKAPLRVIASESHNIWNAACDALEPYVSSTFEMRYLSERDIESLLDLLEKHDSLGYLKALSSEERKHEFRDVHGRQILVALLEATSGLPLMEILENEYKGIFPSEAQLLYLDICSLHRFGPPVRAGLIARMHGINFEEFEEKFFRPLEHIVRLRRDSKSGDYVYEARHSHIANVVYETAIKTQEERFENLSRIVSKLNPAYSYDNDVVGQVLKAENIQRTVPDQLRARQLYTMAIESFGRKPFILQQRGIYEMHVANNAGRLDSAEMFLEEALAAEPFNPAIKHSMAELDLKRSRLATLDIERQSWRRRAEERAASLTSSDRSAYSYHTLMKAAVDGVRDALAAVERDETDTSVLSLGENLKRAEEVLKKGLQKFPNEPRLLGEEGELSNVLSNAVRAESAFKKAFQQNPRSTLVARRLARIYRSKHQFADAEAVLKKAIEANPGAQELQYELAQTLMESAPDADQQQAEMVLYHLRRSFISGAKQYQAQFWYARQLCICDKYDEAKPLFDSLGDLRVPYSERIEIRGTVRTATGAQRRFVGSVAAMRASYGFISCDSPRMRAFVPSPEIGGRVAELLPQSRVSFGLGFNLRGPVAVDVESEDPPRR